MKKIKFLCALLTVLILTGCYDSRDVKNVAIVMGVAVDKNRMGNYKTNTQVVLPGGLSKEGEGETFENYSGEGEYLAKCMENTALKCGKYMYLAHATSLLIGEGVAENGIEEILDYFIRDNELRANMSVAVAKGDIDKIMNTESKILKVPLSAIASLDRRMSETAVGKSVTLFDIASDMKKTNRASLIPIISAEEEKTVVDGSAVFKNGKMIGKISNEEARGIFWLFSETENATLTVEADKNTADVKIKKREAEIKSIQEDMVFIVEISCDVSVLRDNGFLGAEKIKVAVGDKIKNEIFESFEKMKVLDADVYGFEDMFYKKYPEILKNQNGESVLKNARLKISVNTKIKDGESIAGGENK